VAVKQKVVSICQHGGDTSLRCIVDALLAKLDSVTNTDKTVITNLKVRLQDGILLHQYRKTSDRSSRLSILELFVGWPLRRSFNCRTTTKDCPTEMIKPDLPCD